MLGLAAPTAVTAQAHGAEPGKAQDEMKLLKMRLASGVRDREPVDKLTSAKPDQRVGAHVTMRNRTGFSCEIALVFKVSSKERSRVTLTIELSWSFRTRRYVTLRPVDTSSEVTVTIVNDSGDEIETAKLPISRNAP